MFSRLLAPLDGSRLAEVVLPVIERLARACGTSVVLLHIIERGAPTTVHGERHLSTVFDATAYLQTQVGQLQSKGVVAEFHTHDAPEGDVARSIVTHADEVKADLIVLCTHGRGRVREMLFGSIAQQVLRTGTTPVLLVRPDDIEHVGTFAPQRVLVPLDATAAAEAAVRPGQYIARALGASLHLVMVVPTQNTVRGDLQVASTLLPSAAQAALDLESNEAIAYLEGLARQLRPVSPAITVEVRRGNTASVLAEEAAEPGVGLVVVATHGRAGLQAIWTGSVISQLLARTRAPVLLLRTIDP